MATSLKLRPPQRLRRSADFLALRNTGKPYRCPYFMMYTRVRAPESADVSSPRIGISASRKVGNAVERNLAIRRFREIFRQNQNEMKSKGDILLSLRKPATRASYEELEQRFLHAIKFCGLRLPRE